MVESLLSNKNLRDLISKLGISTEQKDFLFNELPSMDKKERLELLNMLKDVYVLNQDRDEAVKKIRATLKKD